MSAIEQRPEVLYLSHVTWDVQSVIRQHFKDFADVRFVRSDDDAERLEKIETADVVTWRLIVRIPAIGFSN